MQMNNVYEKTKDTIIQELESSKMGLTELQVQERTLKYGKNQLQEEQKDSTLKIMLKQFEDFLVIILIIAAVISGVLGDIESAVVILVVITINAILGTVQTLKARASLESLKSLSMPSIKVLRNHLVAVVSPLDITPGDVVVLEAGDYICADGRILEHSSLKVDESPLTGESTPVEKEETILTGETPLADQRNMVFAGSFVTYGRGQYLVTSIGMQTELGKIAAMLNQAKEKKTPLQVSLDKFGKTLSYVIIGICAVLFVLSMWRGESVVDAFVFAVALAVAAIPEALSSIITIMLSIGTQKLSKQNAIIRQLQAVEALGSVSVICSDKTGTLTQNKMTVRHLYVEGEIRDTTEPLSDSSRHLIEAAMLCNDSQLVDEELIGDPTETALIKVGMDYGLSLDVHKDYQRVGEIPFDSERKIMSVVCTQEQGYIMISKGAVDAMLPKMLEVDIEQIETVNRQFSEQGLRVLAVCERVVEQTNITVEQEEAYTFLGLIAMQDPPREEAKEAVEKCKMAGIRPVMITGDHLITAAAIARTIGILEGDAKAIEGAQIEKLTEQELDELVPQVSVYARVTPEHKIRIVDSWQRLGYIVAMTGDGVNDAPALKQADIGVAMGITGSEVAKDSAAMVLADDNFATIVKAVELGRNLYYNIQRALQFLLSGNTAGILVVLYASIVNLPVPFKAVHLLFINLLTDSLPAIALGVEPESTDVMKDKPRQKESSILSKRVLGAIGAEGAIIGIITIIAFYIGLQTSPETAQTMAFATLCLSRLVHGFNCKSHKPVIGGHTLWNNKALIGAFAIGVLLMTMVLLITPIQGIFAVVQLSGIQMCSVYLLALSNLFTIQFLKYIQERLEK